MTNVPAVPRFSDARVTIRWIGAFIIPFVIVVLLVVALLPKPEPALAVALVSSAIFVAVAIFAIYRLRLPPTDATAPVTGAPP
ncbi:MAG: hypothetical protein WB947_04865 [Thermoplasmata archaeon]